MAFIATVKGWFKTKDKPTQTQFYSLFNWLRWKDEQIPINEVENLNSLLTAKAERATVNAHIADNVKHITAEERTKWNETYSLSPISGTNTVTLLKNGNPIGDPIDLTPYLDDSNLARLVSGSVDANGLATFTRDDDSTFTVDLSNLKDTQVQADFNQTDNTKPDYIKGLPLAVLDHNGAEQFKTKELQFDEYFIHNSAEREIQLNVGKLRTSKKTGFSFVLSGVSNYKANYIGSYSKDLGTIFSKDNNNKAFSVIEFPFVLRCSLVALGTVDPTKITYSIYLKPLNHKVEQPFGAALTDSFLIFKHERTSDFAGSTFLQLKESFFATSSSSYTNIIHRDFEVDKLGNVINSTEQITYIRDLNGGSLVDLENVSFSMEVVVSVEFADTTNTNNENKHVGAGVQSRLVLIENLTI